MTNEAVFIDTSAMLPVVDRGSVDHERIRDTLARIAHDDAQLVTHQYVIVESIALIHRRFGRETTRQLIADLLPVIRVVWIDGDRHTEATNRWLQGASNVSFVDWVSFDVMRELGIRRAFALDRDFDAAGFDVVPSA